LADWKFGVRGTFPFSRWCSVQDLQPQSRPNFGPIGPNPEVTQFCGKNWFIRSGVDGLWSRV
jgi:hypothetical protein